VDDRARSGAAMMGIPFLAPAGKQSHSLIRL
jgi:hypothetical protein